MSSAAREALTVMFVDLGNSARLYERLGDEKAHELVTRCLKNLEEIVLQKNGRVIKNIGDEVMCTFPDPTCAAQAAVEMQKSITGGIGDQDLTVHIGLHHGPVVPDRDDVFGDAVNLAARVVALAHPRQILTTGSTANSIRPPLSEQTRWIDRRHVKGKAEDVDLFELVWEPAGDRTEFKGRSRTPKSDAILLLHIGEISLRGDRTKPAITIGRDAGSDVVLNDLSVSRSHAKIEHRARKWVLTDHSSNGTLLEGSDGVRAYVHNEQILLPVAGRIGVGNPEIGKVDMVIRFEQHQIEDQR